MNITQRKYTLQRLEDLHKLKTTAILAENDVLVKASNDNYLVTYKEASMLVLSNPDLIVQNKTQNAYCEFNIYFDASKARKLLNKPLHTLQMARSCSYLTESEIKHGLQSISKTVLGERIVLNEIAERITKLNNRINYAKDEIMLGDAQEALKALEEINSLVF